MASRRQRRLRRKARSRRRARDRGGLTSPRDPIFAVMAPLLSGLAAALAAAFKAPTPPRRVRDLGDAEIVEDSKALPAPQADLP